MITPVIVGPMILPEIPDPSSAECQTMLDYAEALISSLETVVLRLNEVSVNPDEGIILIRNHVYAMLSDAKALKNELNSIRSEAVRKARLSCSESGVV